MSCLHRLVVAALSLLVVACPALAAPLRIATFEVDATPPLGSPLCDGLVPPAETIVDRLSVRGVVLLSDEKPVVLCALDWVGIANGGYDAFREALAKAAGTSAERVAVHCLHQHDAPGCDFEADALLASQGLGGKLFDPVFARRTIERVAAAVGETARSHQPVTHVGFGRAKVEHVASNRRVLGPDGRVKYVRYSATRDPVVRAEPEGTIDPYVQVMSFWNEARPVAAITYYATHPQSYYGKGGVSCDFPGLARALREKELPDVVHVHFNGASGNVTAGKYNDGAPENRTALAERLAAGMKAAWDNQRKEPVTAADVHWRVEPVALPPAAALERSTLEATLADSAEKPLLRLRAARDLAWLARCQAGKTIDLQCLAIGPGRVVHMPGELFIDYQLAAQQMAADRPVLMAAYGNYGPGYIGTAIAYTQGGYETSYVSRVAPGVEDVLMAGLRRLLASAVADSSAERTPQYQFEQITIAGASADEPIAKGLSIDKAVAYLDHGATAWSGSRKCVSCHTNGVYLTVRPALTPKLGAPDPAMREFFVDVLKQKQELPVDKLKKATLPEQVIYLAAGLAEWDRHVTKSLSPETEAALRLMLAVQRDDGTWGAKTCWPPYESDSYHPATVAAMAMAAAPGWLDGLNDDSLKAGVERLKNYLRTTEPPHDYGRVLLLWSAARMPGLIDDARRAELIAMLRRHQRSDGGWSIRTFAKPEQWGDGGRAERLREEASFDNPESDGHMSGLALVVLGEHGVKADDPAIARGLAWLASHQRVSGRWWTRSLNTDNYHFITFSGTAFPLLALAVHDREPGE
ncbi:MAG TPA: prenyltransferase/squalene oxidase repeat-containing protein [Pirellulales bacterium]|jgi:hypothetical protein|nr:prenyltransferase/squalene oxidase repeat-containing protein [Pirellulales bacterium]